MISKDALPAAGRVAVLGSGVMGTLLIERFLADGLVPRERIVAADADPARLEEIARRLGVSVESDNVAAARGASLVVLAVKPQVMGRVLKPLRGALDGSTLVVSVAAGVRTEHIEGVLGNDVRVIRVMPNTPVQVEAGATAFCRGRRATGEDAGFVRRLFGALGDVVEVPEDQMDAVTGLSGSGPAYVFVMVEALSDAGVKVGMSRAQAQALAIQTFLGSAKLLKETGTHPAVLKDMVASPGGTAISGLYEFERSALRKGIIDAVVAATRRARELGEALGREIDETQ